LTTRVDPLVQGFAVVNQDLRHLDVELASQVYPVGKPALRLLGQSIHQDQGHAPLVVREQSREIEPFSDIGSHGTPALSDVEPSSRCPPRDSPGPPRGADPSAVFSTMSSANVITKTPDGQRAGMIFARVSAGPHASFNRDRPTARWNRRFPLLDVPPTGAP